MEILIALVFIAFFVYLIIYFATYKSNTKNTYNSTKNYKPVPITKTQTTINNSDLVYKKKDIYKYEIKGIFYNDYRTTGDFFGECRPNYSTHDKYSIGIYIKNTLAGHTPKANIRLFNSINKYNNNKVFCWGYIFYDEYYNKYSGRVYIPLGFNNDEIENIKEGLNLVETQNSLSKKEEGISEEDFFTILENEKKIFEIFKSNTALESSNYNNKAHFISSFSKRFEKNEEWHKLIKLSNYPKSVNLLSERYLNTTLKRIELAKIKIKATNQ